MAQVNAGRVRFVSRGEYSNSTQYYLFDLVDYEGSSYFAKGNTIGDLPTDTTKWQLIAEKGQQGEQGIQGLTGNGIESIVKTGTSGLVDTYTITFTDGTTTTFEITNGEDGEVSQAQLDETNRMVEQAKLVYNALPKVKGSGEEITLNNTAETPLGITLKGNTSQETTTGKNLIRFPYDATSGTYGNVNVTMNNDGSVTFSGTGNETAYINIALANKIHLGAGTYTLSTKNAGIEFTIRDTSRNFGYISRNQTSATFTLSEAKDFYLFFAVRNGISYNVTIYPMLETGSSATEWEKPTNGASPNPDYPQDIQVVTGNNTIKIQNQNLFNKNATPVYLPAIVTVLDNGIRVAVNSTSNNIATRYLLFDLFGYEGKTFTLSAHAKSSSSNAAMLYMRINDVNGDSGNTYTAQTSSTTLDGNLSVTYTIPSELDSTYHYLVLAFYSTRNVVATTSDYVDYTNVKLEIGPSATEYVEHKEQNYPINLGTLELCKIGDYQDIIKRSTGKNLFDITAFENQLVTGKILNDNGVEVNDASSTYSKYVIPVRANTTYYRKGAWQRMYIYDKNMTLLTRGSAATGFNSSFTVEQDGYIGFQVGNSYWAENKGQEQIEIGQVATNFEPYGVGNWYKYKAIGKVVLDGTEGWNYQYENAWNTEISNIKTVPNVNTQGLIISNYYKKGTGNQVYQRSYGTALPANAQKITIKNIDLANVDALKSWLSTHNTTVYYVLATPTGELITDATLIGQLNNLYYAYAYQGQTNINQENSNLASLMNAETVRDLSDIFDK